jgi:hypothetical protein
MIKTKVNVEAELVQANDVNKKNLNEILEESGLSEIKGFLSYEESRDLEILNTLGPNSVNSTINTIKGAVIELEKAEEFYGNRIFSPTQIKNLCLKYKLKFLPTSEYKGNFDVEVIAKIKALEKHLTNTRDQDRANKEGMTLEEYRAKENYAPFKFDKTQLKQDFAIMAPPSMFNLTVRPAPEKIREIRDYDPVLFYKAGENWAMIHKWGNDFNVTRAIKGFVYKNESTALFTTFLIVCSLLFLGLATFTNLFINGNTAHNILAIIAVFLISPIVSILVLPKSGSDVYSENGWNTSFKR